ncbi:MAG: IreB family regulatory phosphoprotein [Mollicutes bacterium]|nr:IreB family regulatory phosphoprotein [Mollicutes bacterium]
MVGNTKIYDAGEIQDALIEETLRDVIEILKERGYNPVDQIVGYLMSGDPGYISSHKEARTKITQFDRTEIFEFLIKKYCE